MVTQEEADILYNAKKFIPEDFKIKWQPIICKGIQRYTLRVPVITEEGSELILDAFYSNSRRGKSYAFCLLYKSSIPIRIWDYNKHYYKEKFSHKHYWDGLNKSRVYEVDDICLSDVNQAFDDFLKECKIEFNGIYQAII